MPQIEAGAVSIVILSPEPNIGRLKGTIRSIRNNFSSDCGIICSVEKGIKKDQIEEMRTVCPTFRAGKTVTSLINTGVKNSKPGWLMMIMEGAWLPHGVEKKYFKWIKSDSDVLFPIVVDYDLEGFPKRILKNFSDCTLNGLLINREFFLSVGNLTDNPLEISREFWAMDAVEKGAKFKAILGVKIC